MTVSVGIVDDHHIFRSGLIHLIDQTSSFHVLYHTDIQKLLNMIT